MNLLFQVDGKLPNLALMRLSTWLRQRGEEVFLTRSIGDLTFIQPKRVYASSIYGSSHLRREQLGAFYPDAITGGTGYRFKSLLSEVVTDCDPEAIALDYSHYPKFAASLGHSQRGCRLDCSFCRMKTREGDAHSVSTLRSIWRGDPHPKHIHLLDNDFFGQSEWRDKLLEAKEFGFKLCFNQGINIRLINYEQACLLRDAGYWDDSFKTRRLYTAWDNIGDEKRFLSGVEMLRSAGIPPKHLMVYMLIGHKGSTNDPNRLNQPETLEELLYRLNKMRALGCRIYPMVWDRENAAQWLRDFQKWVIRRYCEVPECADFRKFNPKLAHGYKGKTIQSEVLSFTETLST